MIKHVSQKRGMATTHDLKSWEVEGKPEEKKRKVLVTGFRHMQDTLFAIVAFLRRIQRKICSHLCHLPVCQQSCFLLTQENEAIFSI
jgi:hypothetical protein